ncbi:MAG: hypothetical protein ACR2PR_12860 [Pseudohongiellaceae bacterium]
MERLSDDASLIKYIWRQLEPSFHGGQIWRLDILTFAVYRNGESHWLAGNAGMFNSSVATFALALEELEPRVMAGKNFFELAKGK